MERQFYTILHNDTVAAKTRRLELVSDDPSFVAGGEFVQVALDGLYLRRPLSLCESTEGRITLIYKVVGEGTARLAALQPGERLDILTGLGRGFDPGACAGSALLVGGGVGAPPLLPLCRELVARGKRVSVVLGFNSADEIILEREFRALTPDVTLATVDGSAGVKGFVTDAIASRQPAFDYFYTCGPLVMMRRVCEMLETGGEVCLEERMGCGAGYCAGCSIRTRQGTRRVCKDGPVFKKEDLIW